MHLVPLVQAGKYLHSSDGWWKGQSYLVQLGKNQHLIFLSLTEWSEPFSASERFRSIFLESNLAMRLWRAESEVWKSPDSISFLTLVSFWLRSLGSCFTLFCSGSCWPLFLTWRVLVFSGAFSLSYFDFLTFFSLAIIVSRLSSMFLACCSSDLVKVYFWSAFNSRFLYLACSVCLNFGATLSIKWSTSFLACSSEFRTGTKVSRRVSADPFSSTATP